jgi:hypothetical protein
VIGEPLPADMERKALMQALVSQLAAVDRVM